MILCEGISTCQWAGGRMVTLAACWPALAGWGNTPPPSSHYRTSSSKGYSMLKNISTSLINSFEEPNIFLFGSGSTLVPYFGSGSSSSHILPLKTGTWHKIFFMQRCPWSWGWNSSKQIHFWSFCRDVEHKASFSIFN